MPPGQVFGTNLPKHCKAGFRVQLPLLRVIDMSKPYPKPRTENIKLKNGKYVKWTFDELPIAYTFMSDYCKDELHFDDIQSGESVFPFNIKLVRFQNMTRKFSIKWQGIK